MIGSEDVRVVWRYGYHFAVRFRLAVARPVDGVGGGIPRRDGRQTRAAHRDRLPDVLTHVMPRGGVPRAWRARGASAVGEAGRRRSRSCSKRCRGTGEKPAGRGRRRTGRRARHETAAAHKALCGRGAPVRGLHGRGSTRHRRDQQQGAWLHHRGRRPSGAQRDQRDAGQGRAYRRTVRKAPARIIRVSAVRRRAVPT